MATQTDPVARGDAEVRTALLLLVSAVVLVLFLVQATRGDVGGPDVVRFLRVARIAGPWRAAPIEYAPGELLLIRGLFDTATVETAAIRLALVAFAAHVATWGAVRWGWGRTAGERYLIAALPLLLLLYERIDLVPVALAAWGLALVVRERPRGAGALLAAAVLTKLWPVVLLPGILVRGGRRAGVWFAAGTGIGLVAWIAYGGSGAPAQVVTFRGASGWEAGSTVGALVWILGGGPLRQEAGSARVGFAPVWARALLGVVLVGLLIAIWLGARRRDADPGGRPALASVAALLLCTPLFSTQYALWLLPWAGVTSARDRDAGALGVVLVVGLATAAIDLSGYERGTELTAQMATLIRIAGLAWLAARELLPAATPAPARAASAPGASSPPR
ncbi:MAG: glycosyltransferase 87 family protein [Actinomycetota bacterium]